jgi:hypothetical protein
MGVRIPTPDDARKDATALAPAPFEFEKSLAVQ